MLSELTSRMLKDWPDRFPEHRRPADLWYVNVTGSPEGGTTTFLAFGEFGEKPLFAVKVYRDDDPQDRINGECDALGTLRARGGLLASSVPRLILAEPIGGAWVSVQSILDGRPMAATLTEGGSPHVAEAARNFGLAGEWIGLMHRETREVEPSRVEVAVAQAREDIRAFKEIFELSADERAYAEQMDEGLDAIGHVGVCLGHGDFCRHNILLDPLTPSGPVRVIDWTFSRRPSFLLHDLLFFLSGYFLQIRSQYGIEGFMQAFSYTFFDRNAYSAAVRSCVTTYCARLGLATSVIEPLFGLFLIRQAIFEYRQAVRCAERGPLPRFTLYLAALDRKPYEDAAKAQLWIHYYRQYLRDAERFVCGGRA